MEIEIQGRGAKIECIRYKSLPKNLYVMVSLRYI